jgi:radical SAM protein with 4Fe4S-binding SPASM domain
VTLNTHGVYPPADLAYLKTAPVTLFIISIDGLEANHDAIRGEGTFRRAIYSCSELQYAGKKILIGFHVGTTNRSDVPGLIALAAEIGVDVKIAPIRPLGRAIEQLPGELLQPDDYLDLVSHLTRLRRQYPHINILTDFDILDDGPDTPCRPDPAAVSCKAGRTMININYDGGIYPCAFFVTPDETFCAGNIYHDSATTAWQSSPVFRPFRIHQKSAACQACRHYQDRCFGGCPALAHFTAGYLDAHDPTCFASLTENAK